MKTLRKKLLCALSGLLALSVVGSLFLLPASATAADDYEKEMLGTLSASYEAGSPGTISSGVGDSGGKSYGSYQFASAYDIPNTGSMGTHLFTAAGLALMLPCLLLLLKKRRKT